MIWGDTILQEFIVNSIDLHLFFMRIMKEHMFFIETSLTPQNFGFTKKAAKLRNDANSFLKKIVSIANENVKQTTIDADDIVTKYTLDAENATSYFTKVPIDIRITTEEYNLMPTSNRIITINEVTINNLNNEAHRIVSEIISYKTLLLNEVKNCSIFTNNYPLQIDHMLREAKYYLDKIEKLSWKNTTVDSQELLIEEAFWNDIMSEHSKFTSGSLDPSEENLILKSNFFANKFDELEKLAKENTYDIYNVTNMSLEIAKGLKIFQEKDIEGMLNCEIKSTILPLSIDHRLRETNHYIKLLKMVK